MCSQIREPLLWGTFNWTFFCLHMKSEGKKGRKGGMVALAAHLCLFEGIRSRSRPGFCILHTKAHGLVCNPGSDVLECCTVVAFLARSKGNDRLFLLLWICLTLSKKLAISCFFSILGKKKWWCQEYQIICQKNIWMEQICVYHFELKRFKKHSFLLSG